MMGTASTMACIAAALGLMLLRGASAPAVSSARLRIAEETGRHAVAAAASNLVPTSILSRASFLNAITVLQAIGGSTNAVVHLLAIINRHPALHDTLTLSDIDEIGRRTPLLVDLKPSGSNYMTDFHNAGGLPALLHQLRPLLDLSAKTITGATLGESLDSTQHRFRPFPASLAIIRPLSDPIYPSSSLVVLHGNLAPSGAIMKASASLDRRLLSHTGPAVVFEGAADLSARIDTQDLNVTKNSVLVLKKIGPKGHPGMPEAGLIPIPRKLAKEGVVDMLRISDGRMSGTAGGTVVLHVAPEADEAGSAFGIVKSGDMVKVDVESREIRLEVDDMVVEERIRRRREKNDDGNGERVRAKRGYEMLYEACVNQADQGADFDFLTAKGARVQQKGW